MTPMEQTQISFTNVKADADGPILILFKNGDVVEAQSLDGGGIMIGESPGFYEVGVILPDGDMTSYYQTEIAAVLDTSDNQQVEFGNSFIASSQDDHPRPRIL